MILDTVDGRAHCLFPFGCVIESSVHHDTLCTVTGKKAAANAPLPTAVPICHLCCGSMFVVEAVGGVAVPDGVLAEDLPSLIHDVLGPHAPAAVLARHARLAMVWVQGEGESL